jgi:hypothetical protein
MLLLDCLPLLILLKTGTEVERPTRPSTSSTYNRILRVINIIFKGGPQINSADRKIRKFAGIRHLVDQRTIYHADLQMGQVADLRFVDSIFLEICDMRA